MAGRPGADCGDWFCHVCIVVPVLRYMTHWRLTAYLWAAGTVKRIMTQPIVRAAAHIDDAFRPFAQARKLRAL